MNTPGNLPERTGWDLILEPFEPRPKFFREKIREDADELPDLDEQSLQPEDHPLHPPSIPQMICRTNACVPIRPAYRPEEIQPEITAQYPEHHSIDPEQPEATLDAAGPLHGLGRYMINEAPILARAISSSSGSPLTPTAPITRSL